MASRPVESDDERQAHVVRLVCGAQRGDALAMDELLDLLAPYVGRLCTSIALRDGADATQEALIAVFRGIRQLKDPYALFGWVRAVAVREAIRVAKRNSRAIMTELNEIPAPGNAQLAVDIRDVLDRLSPEHRAVLVLRDLEGMDEQAVSALLVVPVGTVRSRLFRARRSFRKAWE